MLRSSVSRLIRVEEEFSTLLKSESDRVKSIEVLIGAFLDVLGEYKSSSC